MNKKLISVAVAAAFAAPMAASADATIYGALHTSVQFNDLEFDGVTLQDNVTVEPNDGALGIKGSEDLGNGLTAVYKIEFNIDGDDGVRSSGRVMDFDEVWVGLSSAWGTVAIGKEDHPYKNAINASGYNPFGDKILDMDANSAAVGGRAFRQETTDNGIVYISPNFSGFSFQGAIVAVEGNGAEGDFNDGLNDGFDAYSLGANFAAGGLKLGAGYEDIDVNAKKDDVSAWFVAGSYALGPFTIGAAYEQTKDDGVNLASLANDVLVSELEVDDEFDDLGYSADGESFGISATYTMGNWVIGGNYVMEKQDDVTYIAVLEDGGAVDGIDGESGKDIDIDSWGIDVSYNFSNRTQVYAAYATAEHDGDFKAEDDRFAVGVVHSF
jgi:predicted porin